MPAPVAEPSESAREALRIAARKLFAEKGFDGVRVKEVAQATGYNPALINYHFGGKEGTVNA
jgi:AcrR family transcriptional regulator